MERITTKRPVTLPTAIYAFVIISALIGAAFLTVALRSAVDRMVQGAMAEAITVRSDGLMKAFTRELSDEWLRMEALSARLSSENPEALRPVMDLMASEGDKISWVGFAAMDGTVTVASNGMLEGANVSERPWFRRGLEGYFAGDVHEAVLLAKLLDPEGENPPRFIDYALPVIDAEGRYIGVLGLHINFDWAAGLVTDLAKALDIDALLVSQDGTIIVSTLDADPAKPTIAPFRQAALAATRAASTQWPDGKTYFSVVLPVEASGQVPNFGWRLISRVDQTAFRTIDADLPSLLVPFILGLVAALSIATVIFVRVFAAPFGAAARNAAAIAGGEDAFPFESQRTQELSQLSAAIARLQGQVRARLSGGPR